MMKLKQLREARDISQRKLASELEVSNQTIANWEKGKSKPQLDNIVKISKYFNVPVNFFLE